METYDTLFRIFYFWSVNCFPGASSCFTAKKDKTKSNFDPGYVNSLENLTLPKTCKKYQKKLMYRWLRGSGSIKMNSVLSHRNAIQSWIAFILCSFVCTVRYCFNRLQWSGPDWWCRWCQWAFIMQRGFKAPLVQKTFKSKEFSAGKNYRTRRKEHHLN